MKRKVLAIILTLALLMGVLTTTGLSVAAEGDLFVTYAKYFPDFTNFLDGKPPLTAAGADLQAPSAALTNGKYATSATDGLVADYAEASRLVFNLNSSMTMDTFLVSSVTGEENYIQHVAIYVSNSIDNLFDAGNLAISTELKEQGGRVTQEGQTIQHALISMVNKQFTGRFVGFDFTNTANASFAAGTVKIGELAAYGSGGTTGQAKLEFIIDPPSETNLLVDAVHNNRVVSAYTGRVPDSRDTELSYLVDGEIITSSDENDRRWCTDWGQGDKLICDLGASTYMFKFLIGSEGGFSEYIQHFEIYVSDKKDTLFNMDNMVYQKHTGLGGANHTVTFERGMTGRYVGFDFSDNNESRGGSIRYFFRMGELGVYGLSVPEVTQQNTSLGVRLDWEGDSAADGFLVYRRQYSKSGWSAWTELDDVTDATYLDETAKAGVKYRYAVRSYRGESMSALKATAPIVCKLVDPVEDTPPVKEDTPPVKEDTPPAQEDVTTPPADEEVPGKEEVTEPTDEENDGDVDQEVDGDTDTEVDGEPDEDDAPAATDKDKDPAIPVWVWILIGAVVLAGAGVGVFLWFKKNKTKA